MLMTAHIKAMFWCKKMVDNEELLSLIAKDYADYWLTEVNGIARIVLEAERYEETDEGKIEYNELYYFTKAAKLLKKSGAHFFSDIELKLIPVDDIKREVKSEGNQYGKAYFGWRFLTILNDRPHSTRYYLHAIKDSDLKRKFVVENILHTSRENVRELIRLGLLETRHTETLGNVTGRSLLNVYREIVNRLTPELMGHTKFPTLDLPTTELIEMIKEQFMQDYKKAIENYSAEKKVKLDKWYEFDFAVSQLKTMPIIFRELIESIGLEVKRKGKTEYVIGLGMAAFFNMPVLKYSYDYGTVFDTRGNIKPQVCRHFSMSSSQFNTLVDRGIIDTKNPSVFIASLRNFYGSILNNMTFDELGIFPYLGDLDKAPEDSFNEVAIKSMTYEEFYKIYNQKFRKGLIKNLPKIADYFGVNLKKKYTAKEIVEIFGIKRSPVSRADEKGILKAVDASVPYNREYHGWSVALLVSMYRPRGRYYLISDEDNTFCSPDIAKKLSIDRKSGFPYLTKEEIKTALDLEIFTKFYVNKKPQLKPGEIYGLWDELIKDIKADDAEFGKLKNEKLKKIKSKSSALKGLTAYEKKFYDNIIGKINEISKERNVSIDKDYSLDEVVKISGLSRSGIAAYLDKGMLKKRGENQFDKYIGCSVAILAGMHDFSKALTFDEAASALYLDLKDINSLIKKKYLKIAYEDQEKITGESAYKAYVSLVSKLDYVKIEKKFGLDIQNKDDMRKKEMYSSILQRFLENFEAFFKTYDKNEVLKTMSLEDAAEELGTNTGLVRLFISGNTLLTDEAPSRIYNVSVEFYKKRPNFRSGVTVEKAKELFYVNDTEIQQMVQCGLIRSQKNGLFRVDSRLASLYDSLLREANKVLLEYIKG